MIADAQALTDNADNPEKVRQNIIEVALDYHGLRIGSGEVYAVYPVTGTGTDRVIFLLYESCYSLQTAEKSYCKDLRSRCVILRQVSRLDSSHIRSARQQISQHSRQRLYR